MSTVDIVKELKGKSVNIDALYNVYLSCNKVWADVVELGVSNTVSAAVYKTKAPAGFPVKGYTTSSIPAITEDDILTGTVVYAQSGQAGYDEGGLPYVQSQNPYAVDASIGYLTGSSVPVAVPYVANDTTSSILEVSLPASLSKINVGDAVEFSIVNNGNITLRIVDNSNYKSVGFDCIYDATSASFKLWRQSSNLYYVIRQA